MKVAGLVRFLALLTDDPEFAPWEVDVHALERADAGALDIENVVGAVHWVVFAVERKRQLRKARNFFTRHSILPIPRFRGTNPGYYITVMSRRRRTAGPTGC